MKMKSKEPIKIDIRHGSAILYVDSKSEPLKVRLIEEHNGNHAEMVACIMADKFELEQ
jgi:hypothetical protein